MTSTAFHNDRQQDVNNINITTSEGLAFLARAAAAQVEPEHVTRARYEIIQAYEDGRLGAVQALDALERRGCLADFEEVMQIICAGYHARLGTVPPEPAQSTLQPPSEDLLQTVAKVRQTSWRAA